MRYGIRARFLLFFFRETVTDADTRRERERERERDRQTDRPAGRKADRRTGRQNLGEARRQGGGGHQLML